MFRGDKPVAATPEMMADRAALAEIAVERTRMPMVVSDPRRPDSPIVLANQAFLDLTGYAAEEVLGRNCRFLQGEGTDPAAVAAIREALRAEREIDIEILNYRRDGSAFWNQLSVSPVHDDAGQLLYVFGSQIDVTDYRKVQSLEASENRLLREVDHRARNVLAVVGGIVRLSRADDATAYAEAIHRRVEVLAGAHSLLAERGWQATPLEDILRREVGAGDPRIVLEGPEVLVPALVVQPVALVAHELMDNARRHGALSAPAGRIEVRWAPAGDPGGFELSWREAGGPAFPSNPQEGFGAAMIEGMVARQLRGRVERQWGGGALLITLTVPGTFEPVRP